MFLFSRRGRIIYKKKESFEPKSTQSRKFKGGKFASRGGRCESGGGDVWGRSVGRNFSNCNAVVQPPTFCPRRRKRRPPTLPPTHRPSPSTLPSHVFAGTRGGSRLLTRNQVIWGLRSERSRTIIIIKCDSRLLSVIIARHPLRN